MAAQNDRLSSPGANYSCRRLYGFVIRHSQSGLYVVLVHLLPDTVSWCIRWLLSVARGGVDDVDSVIGRRVSSKERAISSSSLRRHPS